MLFKQLLYFTTVAETLNISAAAKKLFISQPPISRQIILLEKELGVKLFIRKNKGLELTAPGIILYRQSKDLFTNLDSILANVKDEATSFRGTIKIGTTYSGTPFLIKKLKAFKTKYPEVNINLRTDTPNVLLDELEQGNLSIIFLRNFIHTTSTLTEVTVADDPIQLIISKNLDPYPSRPTLRCQDLKNIPLCTLRPDDAWNYSDFYLDECRKKKVELHIIYECNDTPSIMQLIANGMAASFLPQALVNTMPGQSKLYAKAISGINLSSPLTMVYDNSAYLPSCVRLFIRMIRGSSELPALSNKHFE